MFKIYTVRVKGYNTFKDKEELSEFIIFGRTLWGAKRNALRLFFANKLMEDRNNHYKDIFMMLRRM